MKNKETEGVVDATYTDYGKTIEELALSLCPQIFNDNNYSANTYWITGYGLAGSIASEIAARFSDGGGEVFCYTFGAINTGKGRKGTYLNIKNVINEDDYIPKMMNKEIFTKPGQIYSSSIKEDLLREYRDIIGNTNYKGDYYLSNFISKIFEERKNGISNEMYEKLAREWSRHLEHYSNMSSELQTNGETSDMAIAINNMSIATEDAHSMKSYYVLAKSLNGFDLTDGDGEKIMHFNNIKEMMVYAFSGSQSSEYNDTIAEKEIMDGIRFMANWYINHVYTYKGNKNSSGRGTDKARKYYEAIKDNKKLYTTNGRGLYKFVDEKWGNDAIDSTTDLISFNEDEYWVREWVSNSEAKKHNNAMYIDGAYRYDYNYNNYTNFVGDDCSDFAIAVVMYLNSYIKKEGHRGEKISNDDEYVLYNHTILNDIINEKVVDYNDIDNKYKKANIHKQLYNNNGFKLHQSDGHMLTKENAMNAMFNLGFELYFFDDKVGKWRHRSSEVDEDYDGEMSIDFLQKGDMLIGVCDNPYQSHTEFYVGETSYLNENNECEYKNFDKVNNKAYKTFGWGNNQGYYPLNNAYFDYCENYFRWNKGDDYDGNKYMYIYRMR